MKVLVSVGFLILLSGCAAFTGGNSYNIEYTSPDGTILKAKVDIASEYDQVNAELIKDENGIKSIKFSKIGNKQPTDTFLNLLNKQTELLNRIVPLVVK